MLSAKGAVKGIAGTRMRFFSTTRHLRTTDTPETYDPNGFMLRRGDWPLWENHQKDVSDFVYI